MTVKLTLAAAQTHVKWCAGTALERVSAVAKVPVGTTFTVTVSRAATVKLTFNSMLSGRTVGKQCVAASANNRHAKACTLTKQVGT